MSRKTEPITRNQNRRKFFGRFSQAIPFQISEHTANWLAIRRDRVRELLEGGFKRINFKGIL